MIELNNFTKVYGEFVAVSNLNLKIGAGEMFGFIGPNGAGKSTTIRFLATLLRATAGEGTVNGHSVTKDPIGVRKSVGYMPDNFGVYDGMKVWEFLDFFAVAYQIPRGRRKAVIGDVLELLDLTHKRDDFVNGLSRGMKQRLCLAKTLVHDPPVLILDEPSSGLDPRARLEVKALLKELRTMGKTILISSHILTELADCCTSRSASSSAANCCCTARSKPSTARSSGTATSKSASPATPKPASASSAATPRSATSR